MKPRFILLLCLTGLALGTAAQQKDSKRAPAFTGYQNNRAPLRPNPYIELPLGAIKPQGWIKEMLLRQKSGATGQLDALYPLVMGARNGWLGGDGDQWERAPLPYSMTNGLVAEKEEPIVLIPYGCTSLRISQFPVTGRR